MDFLLLLDLVGAVQRATPKKEGIQQQRTFPHCWNRNYFHGLLCSICNKDDIRNLPDFGILMPNIKSFSIVKVISRFLVSSWEKVYQ